MRRVGRVSTYDAAVAEYAAHLRLDRGHARSAGLKVVLDCAHGAASVAGPLRAARGRRRGGRDLRRARRAEHQRRLRLAPTSSVLQRAVVEHGADVGFALDGDADRCLAVDHEGNVVDGDQLLAVLALAMRDAGTLKADTVVATVMSNLGFVQAMRAEGVGVRQTKVGDRYVLEAMKASGYTLGGEQSGHVIMSGHATTGDGILTALHVLARMAEPAHVAGRAGGRDDTGCPRCWSTSPTSTRRGPTRTRCSLRRWPRRSSSSATAAGCCCGPPAPSRWCG